MAEELLKLYAQRKAVPGHAFAPDTHWQEEFEGAFPYELTADQATAIADIKRDMEIADADGPPALRRRRLRQDRGGDARRVQGGDGRQAGGVSRADDRAGVPAREDAARAVRRIPGDDRHGQPLPHEAGDRRRSSPASPPARSTSSSARTGCCRRTCVFKDLGLLVVDEEQRFGVAHKERIKQMRKKVDVLTMTATPIPRTLNMSLVGIRDMSIIETPPKDRLSIQTNVVKFDAPVIERAIRNELARGGQVYFVHNRVESIFSIGSLLQRLVPEAQDRRSVTARWARTSSRRAMLGFVERRFDILLATTIVENGLDIPNANTIIINRADRYGLSQLYQLRGRVGRSDRAGLRVPADSAAGIAVAGRAQAAGRDQGVQRPRQRLPRGGARPRDSRRRQPARRRAERPHRRRRLRDVHEAARGDDPRAEGRGDRGRPARDGEPARRPEDRRRLHPGHEPAADGLPEGGRGADRERARHRRSTRCATATARRPIRC